MNAKKVDIESQSELSNALYGLGIEDAFIPFKANFTKMSDNSGISLTNVSANEIKAIVLNSKMSCELFP